VLVEPTLSAAGLPILLTEGSLLSDLAGYIERSEERAALKAIVDVIEAYEQKRWPLGKDPNVPGGKG
jgi:hypothetical protein